jgi:hypothetical protein
MFPQLDPISLKQIGLAVQEDILRQAAHDRLCHLGWRHETDGAPAWPGWRAWGRRAALRLARLRRGAREHTSANT